MRLSTSIDTEKAEPKGSAFFVSSNVRMPDPRATLTLTLFYADQGFMRVIDLSILER